MNGQDHFECRTDADATLNVLLLGLATFVGMCAFVFIAWQCVLPS